MYKNHTISPNQVLDQLQWRAAVKKYQTDHVFSAEMEELFNQVLNLAPSAYGLQPYEFFLIKDLEIRNQVAEAGGHQTQMDQASLLYVLASRTELNASDVDRFIADISNQRQVNRAELVGLEQTLLNLVHSSSPAELAQWSARQLYISLGFLLATVALMGIDASPMEGFSQQKVDQLLRLQSRGLTSRVMVAVGARSEADTYQHLPKVRRPLSEIMHVIRSQSDLTPEAKS